MANTERRNVATVQLPFTLTVEQWAETCIMRDAYRTVEMWKNDGTNRRILHFAILASDYDVDSVMAARILACIENTN